MVSLTRLALAHLDFAVLEGSVGAGGASGVSVGENCAGVWVTAGVSGAGVFVFCAVLWAAMVPATAVCTALASAVLSGPQAVMSKETITIVTNSVYFIGLNIFSFHSVEFYYTVKQKRPVFAALD